MCSCRGGLPKSCEHPGELGDSLAAIEADHIRGRYRAIPTARDPEMLIGKRRDLWQVSHYQDLGAMTCEPSQPATYLDGSGSADPGVDFVEHECSHRVAARQHDLKRQHHPGQLTT